MPPIGNTIPTASVLGIVRNAFCTFSSDPDRFARVSADTIVLPTLSGTVTLRRILENNPTGYLNVVNAARGVLCGELPPPPGTGEPPSPFMGGQCPGVLYNFDAASQFPPQGPSPPFPVTDALGPLSYVEFDSDTQRFTQILDGNGDPLVSASTGLTAEQPIIIVTNVTRVDGLPDDCGNPASPIPPPQPGDNTVPVIFPTEDPMGQPVDEPGDVVFGPPYIDDTGGLRFPYNIVFPDGSQTGGDLVPGDDSVELNPVGPGQNVECCGDTGVEEITEEELEEGGNIVVGARVVATIAPGASNISVVAGTGNSPDLYLPDLGTLFFLVETPTGTTGWSEATRIQTLTGVFEAPFPARDIAVLARPNVTFQVTPLVRTAPMNEFTTSGGT